MTKCRVVLIDDQILFVESLMDVLQNRGPEIEIAAVGYNGNDAIELARTHRPNIMLMDVKMPELSGVEAVGRIHADLPDTKIVMLTTYDDDQYVEEAIKNGAIGYLLKDMPITDLIDSLRAINAGAFLLPAGIAQKLIRPKTGTVYHGGFEEHGLPEWYYQLTHKERRILRLIGERYTSKEIAKRVNLAEQTVKNYLPCVYEKMGVSGRKEAVEASIKYKHFL